MPDRRLAHHLGIAGDGAVVARRLSLLLDECRRREDYELERERERALGQGQTREKKCHQAQEFDQEKYDVRDYGDSAWGKGWGGLPGAGISPSLFFGDLRAGDGATTVETMELCRNVGVQAFSWRYAGGVGGEEAGKGAAAAADYEHEDVRKETRCDDKRSRGDV